MQANARKKSTEDRKKYFMAEIQNDLQLSDWATAIEQLRDNS